MDLFIHVGGILVAALVAAVITGHLRRIWFLLASTFLYGAIDWRFPLLLSGIVGITYLAALWLGGASRGPRGIISASALVLLPLATYKYFPVWFSGLEHWLPVSSLNFGGYGSVIVPVGLSFYSFVCCGYLIDVHRRSICPDKNPLRLALFVTFYPTLLSGPIERYGILAERLWIGQRPSPDMVLNGVLMVAYGLFLKEVVSDRMGAAVDTAYALGSAGGATGAWIAFGGFVVQLFADFAGYTLIAIGAGNLFGVSLTVNFRQPFFATSLTEFWQRWHISLTRWIGDYVYRPTAMILVRLTKWSRWWKEATAMYVTWIAMGFWHGAEATFILFVFIQATLMLAHKAIPENLLPGRGSMRRPILGTTATMVAVLLSFGVIRANGLDQYLNLLIGLVTFAPATVTVEVSKIALVGVAVMLTVEAGRHFSPDLVVRSVTTRAVFIILFFIMTFLFGYDGTRDFIYFRY